MARFALRLSAGFLFSAVALVALGSGAKAAPDGGLRLENLVPDRSLAFFSFEDVGSWGKKLEETAIAKMMKEPEMQGFLKPIREDLEKLTKGEGGRSPLPPIVFEVLKQLEGLSGRVAVALVDVVEQHGPVLAATLDFGTHLQDFVAFARRMAAEAAKDGAPIVSEEREGKTWWTFGGGNGPTVTATAVGTSFLISTDATWLQSAAATGGATINAPLGASPAFQASRKSAGGDGLLAFVHANVPAILTKVNLHGEAKRIADALGADTVRSASYGISFKGDGFVESIVLDAPKADHGLVPLLVTKPVSHAALDMAPSTAFYFTESSAPLSTLVPKVREIVGKIDPDALRQMEEVLTKVRDSIGVDLEKDVLAGLADEMALYMAVPETGGLYPELALSFKVKDPAAFEGVMERTVQGIAGAVAEGERVTVTPRTIEYRGKRLHVVDLGSKRRKMVPFAPTWAILGDRLVMTMVPHAMKEIVLRTELGNPSGGLKAQEDVQSLLRTAPENSTGWVYVDLQAAMNLLYDTGVPLLQTIAKPEVMKIPVRLDWAQLPPARVMRPYFRSFAEYVTGDEAGLRVQIRGPLPMMLPMIAVSAAMPMLMTRTHRAGGFAPEMEIPRGGGGGGADFAMLEVNAAVRLYFSDNGRLPATLDELTKSSPKTDRPYLERLPKDRFGHDFGYDRTGDGGDDYSIKSAGADGVFGTEDDVVFPLRVR
jgi:hypothetical protein